VAAWCRSSRGTKVTFLLLLLSGVVLGGYWNTRDWLLTGDPFYPFGVVVQGTSVLAGPANEFHLSLGRMLDNLGNIVVKLGDGLGPFQPDLPGTTGWGWFAYVLGVPSLAWSLWRRPKMRIVCAGFVLSALATLMSTRPSPFNMRYIVWFPAVFAVAFAFAYDGLLNRGTRTRQFVAVIFVACLSLNFPMTITENLIRIPDVVEMLKLPALHRDAASFQVRVPQEYANALRYVPNDALLGYNVTPNGFVYPLFRADFSQRIVYIPFDSENTCQQVAQNMREHNTRYLFVAPEQTDDAKLGLLGGCAKDGTYLRERTRGIYVLNDK
jgi:hypothetical protein